jgi:hypothetical protein
MAIDANCPPDCPPECESVFDRVVVSYLVKGGTRVMWELLDTFTAPNPLTFQLQVGSTLNPNADDWEDVGLPVVNQYYAIDPEQRVWGKLNYAAYRVQVTTADAQVFYSAPTGGMGILKRREWRLARDIVRSRLVYYRREPGSNAQMGYLLKRRWQGPKCPTCLDLQTQESRNPDCPDCYGTGFQCGYFYPMSCVWASLDPKTYRTQLDGGQGRGTIDDIIVKADMIMVALMSEGDVWVNHKTDDRYYIHKVQHTAEMRGVPLTAAIEMRPIPFSSSIYGIEIPEQLAALE